MTFFKQNWNLDEMFYNIFFSVNRENYEPNNSRYCDEVRLMLKVLDRAQPEDCLRTLHLTKGNMHHAIKLVKLKKTCQSARCHRS